MAATEGSLRLPLLDADVTTRVAESLGRVAHAGDTVLLIGGLGAGKTHFTKGLACGLGVSSPIVSPTFNIVITYEDGRIPLSHFDLYRLEDALDLEDVDFYAATDELSGRVCVVEWADMFADEMPDDALIVRIEPSASGSELSRELVASSAGQRGAELLSRWLGALNLQ